MKYLNLGCGLKYVTNPEWVNADMLPVGNEVIRCNFLDGIPFRDHEFNLVYHSHVLEHFSKPDGEKFIGECFRILKPGGVIRIALPNLEKIAREYLANLERALAGDENAAHDYDWILLEMYDQTVRNSSGGSMLDYIAKKEIPNKEYVFNRVGGGAKNWVDPGQVNEKAKPGLVKKILKRPVLLLKGFRHFFVKTVLSSTEYKAYSIGRFRTGGEIHQWMYDRYSLGRLLKQAGFSRITVRSATESFITGWSDYRLDDPSETASLFIEAIA